MKRLKLLAPIVIAVMQWLIMTILQVDKFFFQYEGITKVYILVKIVYLGVLVVIWFWIFNVIKQIRIGNVKYKRAFQVFAFYMAIMIVFIVILWPGTWSWDDISVLNVLHWYSDLAAWQHVLTGLYIDVLLQILPFPGGVIVLQNIMISICVAYVVVNLEDYYDIKRIKYKYMDLFIKTMPFYLPPIIMYQFSGYRMGIYVYLELVLLVMIIGVKKDITMWTWKKVILFSWLVVIVATWRTESFLYVGGMGLLILLAPKLQISLRKKIACLIILICGFYGINTWQNTLLGDENYKIVSVIRPCAELVRVANNQEDSQLLDELNKVVDLDIINSNPNWDGVTLYWNTNVVREDYTKENYKSFLNAFIKLSIKYPKVVIKERWNVFMSTLGVSDDTYTNVEYAATLFDENNNSNAKIMLANGWLADVPVSKTVRRLFINFLGCRGTNNLIIQWLQKIIWNATIPIIALIYGWVRLIIKRKWYLWLILSLVLVKLPLIILTEPAGWIMYVLSFYILGYVYLLYAVLAEVKSRRLKQ